ncbi:hypothetical protein [Mycobacterium uberis]|uniref:hypothetical protein n=1 Tax=Mycobacterium uberis TaxID=2162698 RepID=UPI0026D9018A
MNTTTNDGESAKAKKKLNTPASRVISDAVNKAELFWLQMEFVKLQEWVRRSGTCLIVILEGRDAVGKGGVIKRITDRMSRNTRD